MKENKSNTQQEGWYQSFVKKRISLRRFGTEKDLGLVLENAGYELNERIVQDEIPEKIKGLEGGDEFAIINYDETKEGQVSGGWYLFYVRKNGPVGQGFQERTGKSAF